MFAILALKISSEHPQYGTVIDYCFELTSLHMDLFWTQDSLERFYEYTSDMESPDSPLGLILKKHLIAHTEDDFRFRLYAYQQKVYQLINAVFAIGENEENPKLPEGVSCWVGENEKDVSTRLRFFYENKLIRDMIKQRRALTHRLRPEEMKILRSIERYFDLVYWDPGMEKLGKRDDADVAISSFVVDDHWQKIKGKLGEILRGLSDFGNGLCSDILNSDYLARRGLLREGIKSTFDNSV